MESSVQTHRQFASFTLNQGHPIELAINAESVLEATPVNGHIQAFLTGVDFLEGFMHLRDDTIPVINMKRRLGLPHCEYASSAKVAVIRRSDLRMGLLFDDIKDVLCVPQTCIHPVHPGLLSKNSIISDLIKLDAGRRTLELLDLNMLIDGPGTTGPTGEDAPQSHDDARKNEKKYTRYVVFVSAGQEYAVPVRHTQEITFLSKIDDVFKNDHIEGAVRLRGQAIAVLSSVRLLPNSAAPSLSGENTRVLILNSDGLHYGIIVDEIREIISIGHHDIRPVPQNNRNTVCGIYQRPNLKNIMLIQAENLIKTQHEVLRAMARLKNNAIEPVVSNDGVRCDRSISDHCYLIFSISRNFAIELNDVQEIIESRDILNIPGAGGLDGRVLNLRDRIIPVINMRRFYGYDENPDSDPRGKLIVVRNRTRTVALEVDHIVTIYKQVRSQKTPSLNPRLSEREDTLDRLIEYVGDSGLKEHVLVVNVCAMMDNHLGLTTPTESTTNKIYLEESDHDSDRTSQQPKQTV